MTAKLSLTTLHRQMDEHYRFYKLGKISEKEYLDVIRPMDEAIGEMEIAMLQDSSVLKGSSSKHFPKQ